jgi:hypothetical protein
VRVSGKARLRPTDSDLPFSPINQDDHFEGDHRVRLSEVSQHLLEPRVGTDGIKVGFYSQAQQPRAVPAVALLQKGQRLFFLARLSKTERSPGRVSAPGIGFCLQEEDASISCSAISLFNSDCVSRLRGRHMGSVRLL